MNFISERLENQEDIKYFNSLGFKDIMGKQFSPYWWVIDRDSDMFLFLCGGKTPVTSQKCGLCIDSELVELEVRSKSEENRDKAGLIVHWIISKVEIPISLMQKGYVEEDIMYIMENAFIALGLPGIAMEEIVKTSVEINAVPMIVEKGSKDTEGENDTDGMMQSHRKKHGGRDPVGCGTILAFLIISGAVYYKFNITDTLTMGRLIGAILLLLWYLMFDRKNN